MQTMVADDDDGNWVPYPELDENHIICAVCCYSVSGRNAINTAMDHAQETGHDLYPESVHVRKLGY